MPTKTRPRAYPATLVCQFSDKTGHRPGTGILAIKIFYSKKLQIIVQIDHKNEQSPNFQVKIKI